ncbi:MAG TPA: metal-dependent hydrolase [Halobacteriales archaeon]|nr:metal-dependent hydrolase [Halobacteriales archaeon]
MWPWGHLAVGYLAAATGRREPPGDLAVLVLAVGTQFPDLIDKPLAWNLGVIPNGRSLAHSAIVATLVVVLVWRYAARRDRADLAAAFAIGYYSHLGADALYPLLEGRFGELAFLGWPVLPPIEYTGSTSVVARFAELFRELAAGHVAPTFGFELLLVLAAAALWASQDFPGLALLRSRP